MKNQQSSINPILLVFNREEEKWVNLSNQVIPLIRWNTQLILAYPPGAIHPSYDESIDKWKYDESRKYPFGNLKPSKIVLLDSQSAQEEGYWLIDFFYHWKLLYGFGFKEPNFSKLLCEPNREYKRKVIKVPLLPVGIELRMPAPHIIIEYRRLVHEHIKKLTNK